MNRVLANIRAVLFDLDGTLLDTAADMASALNELRHEEALGPLAFAQIRPEVSHGAGALVRLAFPATSDAEFARLRTRFLQIYRDRLAVHTQPYAGLLDALCDLESRGIVWGIVTNKPGWLTEPLLQQLELLERAAVLVCGDTLAQRKPHPAQLLLAAQRLALAPGQCIYIGDAERDVLAARAAGMDVFVALFGYIQAHERPREWPADGWLETPQALVALLGSIAA
jgi:2-phosphoglycolate phosphatase